MTTAMMTVPTRGGVDTQRGDRKPDFTIRIDPAKRLLLVTMSGTWDLDLVERYAAERCQAFRQLQVAEPRAGGIKMLIDGSRASVQHREVAARLEELIKQSAEHVERVAVVLTSELYRLQTRRVAPGAMHGLFASQEDAMRWLLG